MYVWFACIPKALSVFTGGFVSGILAGAVGSQMPEDWPIPLDERYGDITPPSRQECRRLFHYPHNKDQFVASVTT